MNDLIKFKDFKISYFQAFISWTIITPVISEYEIIIVIILLAIVHLGTFTCYFSLGFFNFYSKLPYFP